MMNGAHSTRDLAQERGVALYDTVESVGDMVSSGVCEPRASGEQAAAGRRRGRRAAPAARSAAGTAPAGIAGARAADKPGSAAQGHSLEAADPAGEEPLRGVPEFSPVPVESLERVLEGLRQLS
jgi:hypothetical protein